MALHEPERRRLNANRHAMRLGSLRLFLLAPEDTDGDTDAPIDFGGAVPGEVLGSIGGWSPLPRKFDQDLNPLPFAILVACFGPYTSALLRTVRSFAVVEAGATTGTRYKTTPSGVVAVEAEAIYRFAGEAEDDEWEVPGATAENAIVFSDGSEWVTDGGDSIVWGEAA